jgi:hypothetical protein
MNITGDILCYTCQTSNGFTSAEQRGIIVLVVIVSIVLILCYTGVLWFGIRSRFISDKKSSNVIVDGSMHNNEAFNNEDEEYVELRDNTRRAITTTSEHVGVEVNDEFYVKPC